MFTIDLIYISHGVLPFMANAPLVLAFSADTDQEKRDEADPEAVFKMIVSEKPDREIFGGDGH